jgi:hypothetical protein
MFSRPRGGPGLVRPALALTALTLLMAPASVGDTTKAPPKPKKAPIATVDSAVVTVTNAKDRNLRLEATGSAATAGWTDAKLVRFLTLDPPPDGIYSFDIVAMPPTDLDDLKKAPTPVAIPSVAWRTYPKDAKAVRFRAEKNCVIVALPGVDKSTISPGDCKLS